MTLKNFVSLVAIAARPRAFATALVYGLSLTVHFTSAAGEKPETPAPAAIMSNDRARTLDEAWRPSIAFHSDWPLGSTDYGEACERTMPNSVDAELLLISIEAPASSNHVFARHQSREACHESGGSDPRMSEKI